LQFKSEQKKSRTGINLPKRIYLQRISGFALSFPPLAARLYQQNEGYFIWALAVIICILWPHIAYFISSRSITPTKAELRNLVYDCVLGGVMTAVVQFNPLITVSMWAMLIMDSIAVGGLKLFYRSITALILVSVLAGVLTGFTVDIETSFISVLLCIPVLLIFPPINGITAYARTLQVIKLKEMIEMQKNEISDVKQQLEIANTDLIETNKSLVETQTIASLDMKMAVNVQMSMLQNSPPEIESWDIAFFYKPMSGVSGDFYDFYVNDDRLEGVAIFDVSGHGISSGLITMIAKSVLFRIFNSGRNSSLSAILKKYNRELYSEISQAQHYLTGVLLRIDGNKIEYVNAAHPNIVKKTADGVEIIEIPDSSERGICFLGIDDKSYGYESISFNLKSNEYLLLYTDCLLESRNGVNEEFGYERILESFENSSDVTAEDLLQHILDDFNSFVKSTDTLGDDLTIIVLRKT